MPLLLAAATSITTYYRTVGNTPEEALAPYDLVTNVALVAAAVALGVAVRLSREARPYASQTSKQIRFFGSIGLETVRRSPARAG